MADNKISFGKINYLIMIGGVLVIFLGFFIMSLDSEPYGFGTLGLNVAPIVVLIGFGIEFLAILYKPKEKNENVDN